MPDRTRAWRFPERFRVAFGHPGLGRLLPAFGLSFLGDGISSIAVPWLAMQVTEPGLRGVSVAVVVAAYTLPGLLSGFFLGRLLYGVNPRALVVADSALRAGVFLAIGAAYLLGRPLSLPVLVALLAVSSLAHPWGVGGRHALVRAIVPGDVLPVNAALSSFQSLASFLGPAIGGVLIAVVGAPIALAVDGLTFVVLAAAVTSVRIGTAPGRDRERPAPRSGIGAVLRDSVLVKLFVLTFSATLFAGFLDVGLPLYVSSVLAAGSMSFGAMWSAFGLGTLLGGLAAVYLRRLPLYETAVAIALGWSLSLAAGVESRTALTCVAAFGIGGLVFGPFPALMATMLQTRLPADLLGAGGAAWSAAMTAAMPLGTLIGGGIAVAAGGLATLRASAYGLALLAIGLGITALAGRRRRAKRVVEVELS